MKYSIIIFLLFCSSLSPAQDFTYSQFYETPLMRNPALAGIFNGNIRIQGAYRNQWNSVSVPYETQSLSAEVTFPFVKTKDLLTVGLQMNSDIAGTSRLNRLQMLPVLSFHKSFDDEVSYLTFAAMGGIVQSQFDFSKLQFNDQFINGQGPVGVTNASFDKTNITYGDASTGLSFNSSMGDDHRYYVGAACYHFLKSKVSFTDPDNLLLKKRWVANAGISLRTGDWDRTYIYGDYILQGGHRQFLSGIIYSHVVKSYVTYSDDPEDNVSLMAGAAYRWGDAFIPILKLEMKKFYIGASYDINISKLKSASQYRGGFECSMAYIATLKSVLRRSIAESVGCPNLF